MIFRDVLGEIYEDRVQYFEWQSFVPMIAVLDIGMVGERELGAFASILPF